MAGTLPCSGCKYARKDPQCPTSYVLFRLKIDLIFAVFNIALYGIVTSDFNDYFVRMANM